MAPVTVNGTSTRASVPKARPNVRVTSVEPPSSATEAAAAASTNSVVSLSVTSTVAALFGHAATV